MPRIDPDDDRRAERFRRQLNVASLEIDDWSCGSFRDAAQQGNDPKRDSRE